jgi:hypothetical protein
MLIEEKVQKLVEVLNKFPCIETFYSCEGHDHPRPSQNPRGVFSVEFFVEPNKRGFTSLERINRVVDQTFQPAHIVLGNVGGVEEGDEPCMCFILTGVGFADHIAGALEAFLDEK